MVEHKIGQVVRADQVDESGKVERIAKKWYKVEAGSSCMQCALQGLGHVLCPEIKCQRDERGDGRSVVYREHDNG